MKKHKQALFEEIMKDRLVARIKATIGVVTVGLFLVAIYFSI